MSHGRRPHLPLPAVALAALLAAATPVPRTAPADVVTLKSGLVYRGDVDRRETIVTVFTERKRTLFRDTKVASLASTAPERLEVFHVDQPMTVHGGAMPASAANLKAGPWSLEPPRIGHRSFEFLAPGNPPRTVRMTQAIYRLGPKTVGVRGVDGFWRGLLATDEVPRPVILALLGNIDQKDQNERLRLGRFLIQAEWYDEALAELGRIAADFPELIDTTQRVRATVQELQARRRFAEIETRRRALQFGAAAEARRDFPAEGAPADILVAVRELIQADENQRAADAALAQAVRKAGDALPRESQEAQREHTLAMLRDLDEAPDAVRERFAPFSAADPAAPPEARFALALSGWLAGAEAATLDPGEAGILARAAAGLHGYLAGRGESERQEALEALRALPLDDPAAGKDGGIRHETLARIARHAPPPLRDPQDEQIGRPRRLRARDDDNAEPTEYVVVLPPEYHPRRSYPAVVVLHGEEEPEEAAAFWGGEAARHGYVVVAPEHNLPGKSRAYRYSSSEHAAVEIALRDALKRFAIDADRVFLAGAVEGGHMAWDFGLAHPDHFAGVAVLSGIPARYVWAYRDNAKYVPLYAVNGDLAPAETELVIPFATAMIARNYETTYVEYMRRALEPLPEEVPAIFDWMDTRRRDPYPKEFAASTARLGDDRFFGIVVQEFAPKKALPPDQADPLGKNIKPATISVKARSQANILDIETSGLSRIDVWLGPPHIDLSRKFELRINRKTVYKGLPKPDIAPFLEDLRLRGDRKQTYALRYQAPLGSPRPR